MKEGHLSWTVGTHIHTSTPALTNTHKINTSLTLPALPLHSDPLWSLLPPTRSTTNSPVSKPDFWLIDFSLEQSSSSSFCVSVIFICALGTKQEALKESLLNCFHWAASWSVLSPDDQMLLPWEPAHHSKQTASCWGREAPVCAESRILDIMDLSNCLPDLGFSFFFPSQLLFLVHNPQWLAPSSLAYVGASSAFSPAVIICPGFMC